jgi:hypothetical protein
MVIDIEGIVQIYPKAAQLYISLFIVISHFQELIYTANRVIQGRGKLKHLQKIRQDYLNIVFVVIYYIKNSVKMAEFFGAVSNDLLKVRLIKQIDMKGK